MLQGIAPAEGARGETREGWAGNNDTGDWGWCQ